MGLEIDESPEEPDAKYGAYRQSERLEIYREYSDILLSNGDAYIAYDSPAELIEQRQEQALRGQASFRYDRN